VVSGGNHFANAAEIRIEAEIKMDHQLREMRKQGPGEGAHSPPHRRTAGPEKGTKNRRRRLLCRPRA
jgi:hypothetical protein